MADFDEIKERLIKLELTVTELVRNVQSSADDRKWLLRIVLGGVISMALVWFANGGLIVDK